MRPAHTLVEAIHRFSPQPIEFGVNSKNEELYVQRVDDPLSDLRVQLINCPDSVDKTLLAGHRGSGKSTELNRLAADPAIAERFEVIRFSVREALELTDIGHVDLLLTLVARTYQGLTERGIGLELTAPTVKALERWQSAVTERMDQRVSGSAADLSLGGEGTGVLGAFFGRIGGRLRYEHTTRELTRETIEPRIGEFIDNLKSFFLDVSIALHKEGRKLLILVEDLDKLPDIERAEALFHDRGPYLSDPPVRIVYTVPIALHYSKKFAQVAGRFGESVFLPNVRLVSHQAGDEPYEPGRDTMRKFVHKRMEASLIEADALERAVDLGGGLFQQTQRLMQKAATKAVGHKHEMLDLDLIEEAASDLRAELERQLSRDDIELLRDVQKTSRASTEQASLDLLHYLHLVEYRNSDRWCAVNPLLEPTLERWKPEGDGEAR